MCKCPCASGRHLLLSVTSCDLSRCAVSFIQCQVGESNLLSTQAFGPTPNGPSLCGVSPVGLSPYNCQGASGSLMGSVLEGRDVRFSRLRPCHPRPPRVWRRARFFLVEVGLELGTLLQGGIRELGAQLLSVALPHPRWHLRREPLQST